MRTTVKLGIEWLSPFRSGTLPCDGTRVRSASDTRSFRCLGDVVSVPTRTSHVSAVFSREPLASLDVCADLKPERLSLQFTHVDKETRADLRDAFADFVREATPHLSVGVPPHKREPYFEQVTRFSMDCTGARVEAITEFGVRCVSMPRGVTFVDHYHIYLVHESPSGSYTLLAHIPVHGVEDLVRE